MRTTAETILSAYADPFVAAETARADFGPGDLLGGDNNTLYLCAPETEQERLRAVFSTVIQQYVDAAYVMAARSGALDPAILVMLDEAANIAPIPALAGLASTGGGQGIQLFTVFQDVAQIRKQYGDAATTIVNNHGARIVTPGQRRPRDSSLRRRGHRYGGVRPAVDDGRGGRPAFADAGHDAPADRAAERGPRSRAGFGPNGLSGSTGSADWVARLPKNGENPINWTNSPVCETQTRGIEVVKVDEADTLDRVEEVAEEGRPVTGADPLMPWAQDAVPLEQNPGGEVDDFRERRIELVVNGGRRQAPARLLALLALIGVALVVSVVALVGGHGHGDGGPGAVRRDSEPAATQVPRSPGPTTNDNRARAKAALTRRVAAKARAERHRRARRNAHRHAERHRRRQAERHRRATRKEEAASANSAATSSATAPSGDGPAEASPSSEASEPEYSEVAPTYEAPATEAPTETASPPPPPSEASPSSETAPAPETSPSEEFRGGFEG